MNSKQIKRFDIVTIGCKQLDNVIIKRVIGLPGEKLFTK
ncbi:MAG: S26 family signal peptidase [Faecalibacillus faecis]